MKDYEDFPPVVIDHGKGVYLYDTEGKSYLDAISSWWVNLFGHSNDRIDNAIKDQLGRLEHCIFVNFSHPPAIELSEKLISVAPKGLSKIFYADNGSSAVEAALKMSFQYHQQTGNLSKTKFVSISDAYHGETLGALSVGGVDLYSKLYEPIMPKAFNIQGPDCFRCPYNATRDTCSVECFSHIEEFVDLNHRTISAVIIEPLVQCAGGMKIYPQEYLRKLRELCTKYNIHLIADEIAVGFGRTGKMFACEHANITPDMMCVSKGITGGYLPLSAVLTTETIYNAFYSDYSEMKAFLHSHSYTGNTLACRAACEVLDIFTEENIIKKNIEKARYIKEVINTYFNGHPNVGELRQQGMIAAIELVKDPRTKEPFDRSERVGYQIYRKAIKKGVLLRPLGNVIYFMPPYVIENNDIEFMVKTAYQSVNEYLRL